MDLTTRERAACREEFGASFDRMPDHPNVLTFVRGYRAGLEASPSEEKVTALVEAAERVCPVPMPGHDYQGEDWRALRAALAALRTTKEGNDTQR